MAIRDIAQAPAVLAEDFGHWLFMDCEQAVYDCGGLAEEILKYFDVRPREGLAVSSTNRVGTGHCWCGLHVDCRDQCDRCNGRGGFARPQPGGAVPSTNRGEGE